MPERCSRLMMGRSRQTAWMELKHPFQIATQVRAKPPMRLPSMLMKNFRRITIDTRAAMMAAMGRTFQSFSLTKKRNCLPR